MGGKSPLIVFEDSDLDAAVEWMLLGIFWGSGQVSGWVSGWLSVSGCGCGWVGGCVGIVFNEGIWLSLLHVV